MLSRISTLVGLVFIVAASALLPAHASAADTIFWANDGNNKISSAKLDGTGGSDLSTEGASTILPIGIALDPAAGRVYWANFGGGLLGAPISSISLAGGAGADLPVGEANATAPNGVAIDPTTKTLYYASFSGFFSPASISFAKLEPTNPEGEGGDLPIEGATINHPNGIAIDPAAKLIYWTNAGSAGKEEGVSVAHLDTGKGEDLKIEGANHELPRGLAVDPVAGLVYWTNFTGNKISFAKLDGSGGGDLPIPAADVEKPMGIAIDHAAGRIYWANSGDSEVETSGSIFTAKLDGADAHAINTAGASIGNPATPSLLVAPRSTAAPAVRGGATEGSKLTCTEGTWAPDMPVSFLYDAAESFAFRWTLDGRALKGATANSVTADAAGAYQCLVTATNRAGSTVSTSVPHPVADRTAPRLTRVSLKPRRFAKRAVLRFVASEPGRLVVKVAKGRKAKAKLSRQVKAGKGKLRLGKRIGKRRLAPGRYGLTVTLRDAAGNVSKPVRRRFTVLGG
jgi:DNA-binding beta-propeller fold protein YncE